MVQIVFALVAGVPIFLFLRKMRALRLRKWQALVLTVVLVIALWIIVQVVVGLGRIL